MKILYPMTVNYDILFQRPQQVLRALAKAGHTCYFINYEPGTEGEYKCEEPTEVEPNFWVLPMDTTRSQLEKLGIDVFYYSYPPHYQQAMGWKAYGIKIIFDVIDSPTDEFHYWGADWEKAVKMADLVLAVSFDLYGKVSELGVTPEMVFNGVEFERFQVESKGYLKKDKKVVGFTGALATWVDKELILKACARFPDVEFAFIGLEYNDRIPNPPDNLVFYGHKSYEDLPYWMVDFDVSILPFRINRVTKACNPLKLWEYMAIGKPIVSTNIPEAQLPNIYLADTHEEFLDNLEKALNEDPKCPQSLLRELNLKRWAKESSWDRRVETITEWYEGLK